MRQNLQLPYSCSLPKLNNYILWIETEPKGIKQLSLSNAYKHLSLFISLFHTKMHEKMHNASPA